MRSVEREELYFLVDKERKRQNKIHPEYPNNNFQRINIVYEELGEVAMDLNDDCLDGVQEELIQVIASCVRFYETLEKEIEIRREKNRLKNKLINMKNQSLFWLNEEQKKQYENEYTATIQTIKEKGFFDILEEHKDEKNN